MKKLIYYLLYGKPIKGHTPKSGISKTYYPFKMKMNDWFNELQVSKFYDKYETLETVKKFKQ